MAQHLPAAWETMDRGAALDHFILDNFETVYATLEQNDPGRLPLLSKYASAKLDRFKQTGRIVDLDEASTVQIRLRWKLRQTIPTRQTD